MENFEKVLKSELGIFKNEFGNFKNEFGNLKNEFGNFKSEIRNELGNFEKHFVEFKEDMKNEMSSFKSEMKEEMSDFKTEIKDEIRDKFFVFEQDYGKEIDAIYDKVVLNEELTEIELKEIKKDIKQNEMRSLDNSIQIGSIKNQNANSNV